MEGDKFEGSVRSYFVVLGSFTIHFILLGFMYTFGIYQYEFTIFFNASNSSVAWVGTTLATVSILFGPLSGTLADRYGYRLMSILGTLLFCVSLLVASFATELWHLVISMGILNGLGISLAYYPAVAVVSHWWVVHRSAANATAVAGAGLGGLALGPLSQALINHFGWAWTLRITAFGSIFLLFLASLIIAPRPVESNLDRSQHSHFDPITNTPTPVSETSGLTSNVGAGKTTEGSETFTLSCLTLVRQLFVNKRFVLLFCACFFECFAYYVPFFFIHSYAINQGMSRGFGAVLLGIMNGASGVGRILLGRVGDTFGYLNCFLYCMTVSTLGLFVWIFCTTEWMMMAFCIMFGFHVGGYISLQAPMMATLFGVERLAGLLGVLYSAGVPGTLFGSVIAGTIVDNFSQNYFPVILFTASTYTLNIFLLFPVWLEQRRVTQEGTEKEGLLNGSRSKHDQSYSRPPPSPRNRNNSVSGAGTGDRYVISSDSEEFINSETLGGQHCDYTRV